MPTTAATPSTERAEKAERHSPPWVAASVNIWDG